MEVFLVLGYILMCIINTLIAQEKHQSAAGVFIGSVLLSPVPLFLFVLAAPDYKQRKNEERIIALLEAMQPPSAPPADEPEPDRVPVDPSTLQPRRASRGNPLFGAK